MSVQTTKRDREVAALFFLKNPMGCQWDWVESGLDPEDNLIDGDTLDLSVVLAEYREELMGGDK